MSIQRLYAKLRYGLDFELRPYEKLVLKAFASELSMYGRVLLTEQLRHLCAYQRLSSEKILAFFSDAGKAQVPSEMLFPFRKEDFVVARVCLRFKSDEGSGLAVTASVVFHRGRLSYLEFDQSPGAALRINAEVVSVKIVADVTKSSSAELSDDDALRALTSRMPRDYLILVGNGVSVVNEWIVYRPVNIMRLPRRDANYYVIAERDGIGFVGVRQGDTSGAIYFLPIDDPGSDLIKVDFRQFLANTQ